jgi:flagellar biosynthesis anti-sigma factor FlgM
MEPNMKITNNPVNSNVGVAPSKAQEKVANSAKTTHSDHKAGVVDGTSIEISEQAQLMNKAKTAALNAELNPVDKILDLKKKVQQGTYKIDTTKLADKIVEEHLNSDFGKNNL